jgi:hypothetical protein
LFNGTQTSHEGVPPKHFWGMLNFHQAAQAEPYNVLLCIERMGEG